MDAGEVVHLQSGDADKDDRAAGISGAEVGGGGVNPLAGKPEGVDEGLLLR